MLGSTGLIAFVAIYGLVISSQFFYKQLSQPALVDMVANLTQDRFQTSNHFTQSHTQAWTDTLINHYQVEGVVIYDQLGSPISTQGAIGNAISGLSLQQLSIKSLNESGKLIELSEGNKSIGWIWLKTTPNLPESFFLVMLVALALMAAISVSIIFMVIAFANKLFILPLAGIIQTALRISSREDFSLRATRYYDDEVGTLTDVFNSMLSRIEHREQMLTMEKEKAEKASNRAIVLSQETRDTNKKLELEVKIRARVESRMKEFQFFLSSIIDSLSSAIIAINYEGKVTQWSAGAERLTGKKASEAANENLFDLVPKLEPFKSTISKALYQNRFQAINKAPWSVNDSQIYLNINISPLNSPLKENEGMGAVLRLDDITQTLKMEEMIVQTEKMISVGGLAAGMAHEINNPLGGIIQSTQNIFRRLDAEKDANIKVADSMDLDLKKVNQYFEERDIKKFLTGIQQSGERAALIVSNMLQFSRQGNRQLLPVDINELLKRSIEIAASDYDLAKGYDFKRIELDQDFDPTIPPVHCISSEIEQVVLNLLKNAAQALKEFAEQKPLDADWYPQIQVTTKLDSKQALIEVSDNGPGMPEDIRKRIFEPFFTTKDVGKGTGLGLSVSYFIIQSHHQGELSVESTPEKGTRFKIRLPVKENRSEKTPTSKTEIEM